MNPLILVVDDEPDVEMLFRQHFRRDLRAGRFIMEFAQSHLLHFGASQMQQVCSLILVLSDIDIRRSAVWNSCPRPRLCDQTSRSS